MSQCFASLHIYNKHLLFPRTFLLYTGVSFSSAWLHILSNPNEGKIKRNLSHKFSSIYCLASTLLSQLQFAFLSVFCNCFYIYSQYSSECLPAWVPRSAAFYSLSSLFCLSDYCNFMCLIHLHCHPFPW